MKLTPVVQKFILHWGELGTRWGINRTVAQIHALLYVSPKPLNAEEIAETLEIPLNTAASRYRYGLDKMRARLRPIYEELK